MSNLRDEILKVYPYMYETHMHTCESSKCAHNTSVEMAKAHKEKGYTGIFITNHNWGGNTSIDRELPFADWIDKFYECYYPAKEWGDANDFQVFYAYEAGFDGTEFLIYGLSIDWMKNHPEIRDASVKEQFELVNSQGGLVIHAHPYREAFYLDGIRLFPEYVHGVEGLNGGHTSPKSLGAFAGRPDFNEKAIAYAKEHGFVITGGSDTHSTDLFGGGVAFKNKLESVEDYIKQIKSGRNYVVTDGITWLDSYGNTIDLK